MSKGEGSARVRGGIERQKDDGVEAPTSKTSFTQTQITNSYKGY
jgi:hypothetical protein